jgi:hypothetical protein
MSAYLPNDIALSVTFIPQIRSVFAIIYGCSSSQLLSLEKRVKAAGHAANHPLLLVGILAELERERLVGIADDLIDKFTLRSEILENIYWNPQQDMNSQKTQEYLALCLQSRSLVDHIRAVKRQLVKFLEAIDGVSTWMESPTSQVNYDYEKSLSLNETGKRIKKRIEEIVDEYDDKIDECNMMTENLALTMQTVRLSLPPKY